MEYGILMAVVFAGSFLQGMSGFGFGLFAMAILPFFLPLPTAAALVASVAAFVGLIMVWRLREHLQLRAVLVPLTAVLIATPLGVYILKVADETVLRTVLGVLIIAAALFFIFDVSKFFTIEPTPKNAIGAGALSGVMGGMFNIGGPPLVLYFVQTARDNLSYKASLEFIFFTASTMRLVSHFSLGNLTRADAGLVLAALIAGLSGAFLGLRLLRRMNLKQITPFVSGVMLLAGLGLIFLH